MTTEATLFAHIIPRLTDRSEDIAVEALGYILSQSTASKRALETLVAAGGAEVTSIAGVRTQVAGADGATPDLSCLDEQDTESVLIEAKFWAGLTDNQPNTYLARLPKDRPSSLLFVAPAQRLETLWPEILRRAQAKYQLDSIRETGDLRSAIIADSPRRLMLASWRALLARMAASASDANETNAVANIRQLSGLAERMDADAFLPLRSAELGPEIPRRMEGLRQLVADASNRALTTGWLNSSGLAWTARHTGSGRYLRLANEEAGAIAWFGIDTERWAKYRGTPLWLQLHDLHQLDIDEVRRRLEPLKSSDQNAGLLEIGGNRFIPIDLPTGVEREKVVDAVAERLEYVARLLNPNGRDRPQT